MTAYNVVRFRVKPGMDQAFIDSQRAQMVPLAGFLGGGLVKTGERTFCFVGHWRSFDDIVAARPQMIAILDKDRPLLEDLGNGLGVTDPVSGEVVVELPASM
jgi:hypothetical protein